MKISLNIGQIKKSLAFQHMVCVVSLIAIAAMMLKLIILPAPVDKIPAFAIVVFYTTLLFAYLQSEMIYEVVDHYEGKMPKHYLVLPVFGMIVIILFEMCLATLSGDVAKHWSFAIQFFLIMQLHISKSMVKIRHLSKPFNKINNLINE